MGSGVSHTRSKAGAAGEAEGGIEASLSDLLGGAAEGEAQGGLGRYLLLRELGRGAIGVVYAAYHEGLDRKLAIKVLNRSRAGKADFEARLRREARALARLSHPNVVQVYDVGEVGGRVYVVMEFVEGQTLSEWLERSPRPSLEAILELFVAVGRGLAAAHAAGVIHRDFKPDNVIVGSEGRPRVLDFGLARAVSERGKGRAAEDSKASTGEPAASGAASAAQADLLPSKRDEAGDALEETAATRQGAQETPLGRELERTGVALAQAELEQLELTRTGAQVGTPAYMSPEQFLALPASPASDQFGFCVSLHEAVYGVRPYAAKTKSTLMAQVHGAAFIEAPPSSSVPKWLRELILRGLSPRPKDRWPSMEALMEALIERPREQRARVMRRRRWGGVMSAGVFLAALGVGLSGRELRPHCIDTSEHVGTLWPELRAQQVKLAFSRSGLGYAEAAWLVAEPRIEGWVEAWAARRVELCEARLSAGDEVKAAQATSTDALRRELDLRQACLARAGRAFSALSEQLVDADADARVVENAVEAVASLPDPASCETQVGLDGGLEPPPRAVAAEVRGIRDQLAELDTRRSTGRWRSGLALAKVSVERARGSGYAPVLAEALFSHGRLEARAGRAGDVEGALTLLQDALDQADRSGHQWLAPRVATELVSLSIYARPDPLRGRVWSRRMHAGLDRLERAEAMSAAELGLARARAAWAQGNLERLDGDNPAAEAQLRIALELLELYAPAHPERGVMLNDLANALASGGEREGARRSYELALAACLAAFGEGHPRVGNVHFGLARLARDEGELERAREQSDAAFVIYAAARGSGHRDVGDVELLRAAIALDGGDPNEGRARALAAQSIFARALAADNIDLAEPYQMLGNAAFMLGELEQGLDEYQRALEVKRRALPPGHVELVPTLTNMGLIYLMLERPAFAVSPLTEALQGLESSAGVDPQALRLNRLYLGDTYLALGDAASLAAAAEVLALAAAGCDAGEDETCAAIHDKLVAARAGVQTSL